MPVSLVRANELDRSRTGKDQGAKKRGPSDKLLVRVQSCCEPLATAQTLTAASQPANPPPGQRAKSLGGWYSRVVGRQQQQAASSVMGQPAAGCRLVKQASSSLVDKLTLMIKRSAGAGLEQPYAERRGSAGTPRGLFGELSRRLARRCRWPPRSAPPAEPSRSASCSSLLSGSQGGAQAPAHQPEAGCCSCNSDSNSSSGVATCSLSVALSSEPAAGDLGGVCAGTEPHLYATSCQNMDDILLLDCCCSSHTTTTDCCCGMGSQRELAASTGSHAPAPASRAVNCQDHCQGRHSPSQSQSQSQSQSPSQSNAVSLSSVRLALPTAARPAVSSSSMDVALTTSLVVSSGVRVGGSDVGLAASGKQSAHTSGSSHLSDTNTSIQAARHQFSQVFFNFWSSGAKLDPSSVSSQKANPKSQQPEPKLPAPEQPYDRNMPDATAVIEASLPPQAPPAQSHRSAAKEKKRRQQRDAEKVEKLRLLVSYLRSASSQPVLKPVALEADEIELAQRYKLHRILCEDCLQQAEQQQQLVLLTSSPSGSHLFASASPGSKEATGSQSQLLQPSLRPTASAGSMLSAWGEPTPPLSAPLCYRCRKPTGSSYASNLNVAANGNSVDYNHDKNNQQDSLSVNNLHQPSKGSSSQSINSSLDLVATPQITHSGNQNIASVGSVCNATSTPIATSPSANGSTLTSALMTPSSTITTTSVSTTAFSSLNTTNPLAKNDIPHHNLASWIDNEVNSLVNDLEHESQLVRNEKHSKSGGKLKWLYGGGSRRNSSGAHST